ncbi:phosphoribosyltransferase family protein [Nocardioides humi]|uniref:Phosphoribosyltransferase family protein n=1 Tax=Nocardioides humi TaxID=449461 RepID=A0ABN2B516_9ACTN|nr:phosphoribosyltransferase family protein [Nocardioides humi]
MDGIRSLLQESFRWQGDRYDDGGLADVTGWWRSPTVLGALAGALSDLVDAAEATVVLAPPSRGTLLGSLVAAHLGVGLVELRKDPCPAADSDAWRIRTSPPDYRDRNLVLGFRRELIRSRDRVLFVDDWIETGGQALTGKALVDEAGATWLGAAVVVDGLETPAHRRLLGLRALLHVRDL